MPGQEMAVGADDRAQAGSVHPIAEEIDRVGTVQAATACGEMLVPKALERPGLLLVPIGPEQADHLAEGANLPAAGAGEHLGEDAAHYGLEPALIQLTLDQEPIQSLPGIEKDEPAIALGRERGIGGFLGEVARDSLGMRGGGDDEEPIELSRAFRQEAADILGETQVILAVELDDVSPR